MASMQSIESMGAIGRRARERAGRMSGRTSDRPSHRPRRLHRSRRSRGRAPLRALLFLAVALPAAAAAHDTWLEQRPGRAGRVELALSTGELFPAAQTGIAAQSLVDRGCWSASGRRVPLQAAMALPTALALRAAPRRGDTIAQCWVQTEAFDVEVPRPLVPVYLREIAASDSVRRAWAEQAQQGLPWQERYTKHARISLEQPVAAAAPATPPPPMALDIEIDIDIEAPLRAGETLRFRMLRDGRPLANQAVELRGEMSRFGVWRQTDAEGRARVPVPFPGRWLLRATELRPLADRPGHWESRFVTHTFTVAPAEAASAQGRGQLAAGGQPSSPSTPRARSANHSSATTTMTAEPPISTARR